MQRDKKHKVKERKKESKWQQQHDRFASADGEGGSVYMPIYICIYADNREEKKLHKMEPLRERV